MGRARLARAVGLSVTVAAVAGWAVAPVAAGGVGKAQCGAQTESSPGFRTYLPDCRAYELVTPPYKEGGVVLDEPGAIAMDGTHVIAGAGGAFAGAGNLFYQPNSNPGMTSYEFTRTAAGWAPEVLTPPATEYPTSAILAASAAEGEDLGPTLWGAARRKGPPDESIYRRNNDREFLPVGPGLAPEVAGEEVGSEEELYFAGASRDLSRSLFQIKASGLSQRAGHKGHSNLWPGDTTAPEALSLYEYVGTGNAAPTLVGVSDGSTVVGGVTLPAGHLISNCGTELGSGRGGSAYNAVSEDGETVFVTASTCGSSPAVDEVYARINGENTVAISEPSLPAGECNSGEPCSSAEHKSGVFQGASQNGEYVFFLSEQPLVNGAPAAGIKLYEARLEGSTVSQLVDVSADPTSGQSPEVQGVVRVSEDGERAYFVAKGVLAGINAEGEEPEAEADNLYVYEPDPAHVGAYHTVFVATLLTPAEKAALEGGEAEEANGIEKQADTTYQYEEAEVIGEYERGEVGFERALEMLAEASDRKSVFIENTTGTRGPSGTLAEDQRVWQSADSRPAQATPDGDFLMFLSSADLTAGDESKVPQLFEYDAGEEKLTRVSIGQGGTYSGDGNVSTFHAAPRIPAQSFAASDLPTAAESGVAVSEDGSRVFFTSAAGLTPQAEKGTNVYEYRAGDVYLVSGGDDASLNNGSPTVQLFGIDPSGRDAFFTTAAPLVPQDGETQMALYDAREEGGFPAPALVPGCSGETCRGATGTPPQLQLPGSTSQAGGGNLLPAVEVKPATKPKAVVKVRGHSVHGTTITLTVAAPAKGTIVVYGAGLQTTKHRAGGAMTYTLKVALSARARALVKRPRRHKLRYKLKLTVRVRFVPTSGKASQTSVLAMVQV